MTGAARRDAPPGPPGRGLVHLGLGSFFRAHQAWYTDHAPDAAEWGIAAFTGRRPDLADALAAQDGLYTLITRGPAGDDVRGDRLRCRPPTRRPTTPPGWATWRRPGRSPRSR